MLVTPGWPVCCFCSNVSCSSFGITMRSESIRRSSTMVRKLSSGKTPYGSHRCCFKASRFLGSGLCVEAHDLTWSLCIMLKVTGQFRADTLKVYLFSESTSTDDMTTFSSDGLVAFRIVSSASACPKLFVAAYLIPKSHLSNAVAQCCKPFAIWIGMSFPRQRWPVIACGWCTTWNSTM